MPFICLYSRYTLTKFIWYQRASLRYLAFIAFWVLGFWVTIQKRICSLLSLRYSSRVQRHYGGLTVSFDLPPTHPTFIGCLLLAYSFNGSYLFMYWLILASRSFFLSGEAWSRNSLLRVWTMSRSVSRLRILETTYSLVIIRWLTGP